MWKTLPILIFLSFQLFQIKERCLTHVSPEKISQEAGFQRHSHSELLASEHHSLYPHPQAPLIKLWPVSSTVLRGWRTHWASPFTHELSQGSLIHGPFSSPPFLLPSFSSLSPFLPINIYSNFFYASYCSWYQGQSNEQNRQNPCTCTGNLGGCSMGNRQQTLINMSCSTIIAMRKNKTGKGVHSGMEEGGSEGRPL